MQCTVQYLAQTTIFYLRYVVMTMSTKVICTKDAMMTCNQLASESIYLQGITLISTACPFLLPFIRVSEILLKFAALSPDIIFQHSPSNFQPMKKALSDTTHNQYGRSNNDSTLCTRRLSQLRTVCDWLTSNVSVLSTIISFQIYIQKKTRF